MNNVMAVSKGRKDIHSTIFIVKVILLFFSVVGYFESYAIRENTFIQKFGIIFCGPLILYGLWRILPAGFSKYNKNNNAKMFQMVDNIIFMYITAFLIITSSHEFNVYKVLFLVIIVTSVIQFGMNFGISIGIIASIIILIVDIYKIHYNLELYIANDVTLIIIYFLISYIIGSYVRNQTEISLINEKKLEQLQNIIENESKHKVAMQDMLNKYKKNADNYKKAEDRNVEFISNVIHDLKTPLNVIFSALQVLNMPDHLGDKELLHKNKKYIKVMKQNCYRLTKLINNLLDVTKLQTGYLKLNNHNRNIVSVVEDTVTSVVPYIESKGISITFDTDVEERIMAIDCDKIERIILNILSNSIKFTKQNGSIFVNIEDKSNFVFITIEDNGIGIPEDKLNMVFGRFNQVDSEHRGCCEGSGIGLYLVKSFVELHNGKIYVESKYGFGTKFTIELPVLKLNEKVCEGFEDIHNCGSNKDKVNIEFSDIPIEM
jgi:signal transduction histidine kinase